MSLILWRLESQASFCFVGSGEWGVGSGEWGLGIGEWGLGIGDWGK